MTYRNRALLDLAKHAPCCADFEHRCMPETVVAAHRNEGKGMGLKRPDYEVAFLCFNAHNLIDLGSDRDLSRSLWLRAFWNTQEWIWNEGKVAVTGHTQREPAPKKLAKILPRNWPPRAA